jgi:hypothetical protein
LQGGFLCVVEQSSGIAGFEPSVREIPSKMFVPPTWKNDSSSGGSCCFIYKLRSIPGKIYSLNVVQFDDTAVVTFLQRNGGESSFEVSLSDMIADATENTSTESFGAFRVLQFENLEKQMTTAITRLVPNFQPTNHTASSTINSNSASVPINTVPAGMPTTSFTPSLSFGPQRDLRVPPLAAAAAAPGSSSSPGSYRPPVSAASSNNALPGFVPANRNITPSAPANVGSSDLDPFSNIPGHSATGGFAGNVIGPNHPIFGNAPFGPPGNYPSFPSGQQPPLPGFAPLAGFQPPQPRYDPITPPFTHNQNILFGSNPTPNINNNRNHNNMQAHPLHPGEPNHDLEPLPGFGDIDLPPSSGGMNVPFGGEEGEFGMNPLDPNANPSLMGGGMFPNTNNVAGRGPGNTRRNNNNNNHNNW